MSERVTREQPRVDEVWSRLLDANLRYYRELTDLSLEYVDALAGSLGKVRLPLRFATSPVRQAPPVEQHQESAHVHRPERTTSPALVLEGEGGAEATGVFSVENHLSHTVTAPIVGSRFTDPDGREVPLAVRFDPESVSIGPGERALVRIVALVAEDLPPDVDHGAEVSVPGLGPSGIRVVLRRRASASASAAAAGTSRPRRSRPRKSSG